MGDEVSDAFLALLAVEQGRPTSAPARTHTLELTEGAIDRIAARVVQRLLEGPLGDTVTRVVEEVSERLVREEIARIRRAADEEPP
ncbi:MAG: hypothetical protein ACT4QD_11395 [Acidobacteriota bacterium]